MTTLCTFSVVVGSDRTNPKLDGRLFVLYFTMFILHVVYVRIQAAGIP